MKIKNDYNLNLFTTAKMDGSDGSARYYIYAKKGQLHWDTKTGIIGEIIRAVTSFFHIRNYKLEDIFIDSYKIFKRRGVNVFDIFTSDLVYFFQEIVKTCQQINMTYLSEDWKQNTKQQLSVALKPKVNELFLSLYNMDYICSRIQGKKHKNPEKINQQILKFYSNFETKIMKIMEPLNQKNFKDKEIKEKVNQIKNLFLEKRQNNLSD